MSDSNVVPFNPNQLSAEYDGLFDPDQTNDLISGVSTGFGVVSIRGSKWRIKHAGEETPVTDDNGEPVASLPVVLVKASPNVSRIYYAKSFEDGDAEEPDCYSTDGVAPATGVRNKQCDTCAVCPHQVWGSKITPAGKKAKACADNRRIAVVPLHDLENEVNDGPLLLRVPAASLSDLALYGKKLIEKGRAYNSVATRLGFDVNASYPKLTFKGMRALSEEELKQVAKHLRGDVVTAILAAEPEASATEAVSSPSVDVEFEEEEEEVKTDKPARKTATKAKTAKPKAVKAVEKEAESTPDASSATINDDLDDLLSDLDDLA